MKEMEINNMAKMIIKKYTEVKIGESSFEKSYKNPLTKTYQYEYALFTAVSDLFDHVECRSMCIDSLRMYFRELPVKGKDEDATEDKDSQVANIKKMNQERLIDNMKTMVSSDVIGHITFPMMNKCAAEVTTITGKDGTHWFVFDDGIYGFAVHLTLEKNKKPVAIEVRCFNA